MADPVLNKSRLKFPANLVKLPSTESFGWIPQVWCSGISYLAVRVKVQSRISPGSRMESELGSVVSRDAFYCFTYMN
jgi:hypothetical protein